jgi:AcrR family transcriptional regulator
MKSRRHPKARGPTGLTQPERRAATIATLIDATVESILAIGYAHTTVKEICRRATLSDGALFRFFPTLLDLVLAAVSEVGQRQIAQFESRFAAVNDGTTPLLTALSVLRDVCRSKNNVVFFELLGAARTDAVLRRKLAPALEAYRTAIRGAAGRLPGIESLDPEIRDSIVFGIAHVFEGEALVNHISPQRAEDDQRLDLLKQLLVALTSEGRRPSVRPKQRVRAS